MNDSELGPSYTLLGLQPGCTVENLERAFMKKNFALIKGANDEARQQLRAAHETLAAHLKAKIAQERAETPRVPGSLPPPVRAAGLLTPPTIEARTRGADESALFAFDNWKVNVFVPPLVVACAWLVNLSPLGFLLKGFHVWVHEFGHATAAWLTGRKALPLPIGWTSIEAPYSPFVYFGILVLLAVLFIAGWKERKVWPMLIAVAIAPLQYFMTWRLSAHDQQFWWTFCGLGGEFYLSALFMACFFVQLPEKFRWGACRYLLLFLGASCFLNIYLSWRDVYHGVADIPMGSMVNGEDDAGGDMNVLISDYHWTNSKIRLTYHLLGNWCLIGLGVVYATFVFRLNRIPDLIVAKFASGNRGDDTKAGS
jgi:hypothetical protein